MKKTIKVILAILAIIIIVFYLWRRDARYFGRLRFPTEKEAREAGVFNGEYAPLKRYVKISDTDSVPMPNAIRHQIVVRHVYFYIWKGLKKFPGNSLVIPIEDLRAGELFAISDAANTDYPYGHQGLFKHYYCYEDFDNLVYAQDTIRLYVMKLDTKAEKVESWMLYPCITPPVDSVLYVRIK